MAFMKEFHLRGKLSNQIRASFIALIPKKVGADCIKDFFPINLIGCIYKILDKVLAARIKIVLPSISICQGAFVHGRQIFDSVLIANECLHSCKICSRLGLLCKLDLEKAHHRVDSDFSHYMWRRLGWALG